MNESMQKYRPPTAEGRKQIAINFVYDKRSENDIRHHYLDRGVNIGNLRHIVEDPKVINAVCLEKNMTYDNYEQNLRVAWRREASGTAFPSS